MEASWTLRLRRRLPPHWRQLAPPHGGSLRLRLALIQGFSQFPRGSPPFHRSNSQSRLSCAPCRSRLCVQYDCVTSLCSLRHFSPSGRTRSWKSPSHITFTLWHISETSAYATLLCLMERGDGICRFFISSTPRFHRSPTQIGVFLAMASSRRPSKAASLRIGFYDYHRRICVSSRLALARLIALVIWDRPF